MEEHFSFPTPKPAVTAPLKWPTLDKSNPRNISNDFYINNILMRYKIRLLGSKR
jgi:hypothetical protein